MKTTRKHFSKPMETNTANVFRDLFEIQMQLEARIDVDPMYQTEITEIIQSIDHLFERVMNE